MMPNFLRKVSNKIKGKGKETRNKDQSRNDPEFQEVQDSEQESSSTLTEDGFGPLDFPVQGVEPARGVDIVFVHGLRGFRLKTWSRGGIFWPRDLLQKDLREARVITWGYDANIANAFSYASKESLSGHANTLLSDLARLRHGVTRPIIFVCHSLGGLVVKEALITSDNYKNHKRHVSLGEIYANTIGVLFMGTPHRGSAKESYGGVVANIARLGFRQPNQQLLQTLHPESHILEKQRDDFTTISKDMDIVCIREELPTGVGIIVPEASASYDGFNVSRGSIHANHMDMAKFSSRNEEGYQRTLGYIKTILDTKQSTVKQDTLMTESQRDVILKAILKALEFPTINSRVEEIEDAYVKTCSWILDDEVSESTTTPSRFTSWLHSDEAFFWISGKAGSGKSTLMKYVYHDERTKATLEKSSWIQGKELILVGHFFSDSGNDQRKSREGMLRNILYQTLRISPRLIPEGFSRRELEMPADFLTWANLRKMFFAMLDSLEDSKMCLFLDGLDEYRKVDRAKDYTEKELDLIYDGENEDEAWGSSSWITDGHNEIADFILRLKDYRNVKVVFASRDLNVFEREFRSFPRIIVHDHTFSAIAQFCQDYLNDKAPDLASIPKFASNIARNSRGVFLWVRLVVNKLVEGYTDGNSEQELQRVLDALPPRLGGENGLYQHMMARIKREHLPESRRLFQIITKWEEHSAESLPDIMNLFLAEEWHLERDDPHVLIKAERDEYQPKTWDELQPKCTELLRRLKSRCGGLLEGIDSVGYTHQTAKQFISRKYIRDEIFQSTAGFDTVYDIDLAILSGCIRRWKYCAEVVATPDNISISAQKNNMFPIITIKRTLISRHSLSNIFLLIRIIQSYTSGTHGSTSYHHCFYIQLLDELDKIGNRHTAAIKSRINDPNTGWPEAYTQRYSRTVSRSLPGDTLRFSRMKINSFLELAVILNFALYVETKVANQQLSKDRLGCLLLQASQGQDICLWGHGLPKLHYASPTIVRVLFQEGADPHFPATKSISAVKIVGEGWTAWTCLLHDYMASKPGSMPDFHWDFWEAWADKVKLFLHNGADPTVQWTVQIDNETESLTPEKAIRGANLSKETKEELLDLCAKATRKRLPGDREVFES